MLRRDCYTLEVIHGLANCPNQVRSIVLPRKPWKNRLRRCLLQLPEEGRLTANPRERRRKRVWIPRRNEEPIYFFLNHEGDAPFICERCRYKTPIAVWREGTSGRLGD
jgi:hypothetical protein